MHGGSIKVINEELDNKFPVKNLWELLQDSKVWKTFEEIVILHVFN